VLSFGETFQVGAGSIPEDTVRKSSFRVPQHVSVSLASIVKRRGQDLQPAFAARVAGFRGDDTEHTHSSDRLDLLLECKKPGLVEKMSDLAPGEEMRNIGDKFVSAQVTAATAEKLVKEPAISRIQTKKLSVPHLNAALPDVRLLNGGQRAVPEDGTGVLIGVVDSGFDLSHPVFRDADGNLRVEALLDQKAGNRTFETAALTSAWSSGQGPGADEDGHGTHVACIAGGSRFGDCEGVASGARFLLVRTDFVNTDTAVRWIFDQAARLGRPCVVNMSLGHHFGSHDGTDAEERFHRTVVGPGRLLVISAGNERDDSLHIGGRFFAGQAQEIAFDLLRQPKGNPFVTLTLWHHQDDDFQVALTNPAGATVELPKLGMTDLYQSSNLDLELSRRSYVWSQAVQLQITIEFKGFFRSRDLLNWRLRLNCRRAAVGRIDGWFHNSGHAIFSRDHPLVERHRTIGVPATGDACLAVGSHVARNQWTADLGPMEDLQVVQGRISNFSSLGPTRDGRWKPDISAPGQYVTAALADHSSMADLDERALVNSRLVTIEGTSMAAPVVSGVVALMLQRKPGLTVEEARRLLAETARHDAHTGSAAWEPAYGFGKVDVAAAMSKL
jgi:subtilisin family serine protease